MNHKYPHSGLTVEETDELEAAGWSETSLESLPPPWSCQTYPGIASPRSALAIVREEPLTLRIKRPVNDSDIIALLVTVKEFSATGRVSELPEGAPIQVVKVPR
jgi:hypothetical protein